MYGLIFKLQRFSVYGTEGNDSLTVDANGSLTTAIGFLSQAAMVIYRQLPFSLFFC